MEGSYIYTKDGLPLAVFETGNASGPPLILLHGFGYSHAVFRPQFESDLAHDFRLIALDLRGHGYSAKPWNEDAYAGTEVWADDLELVLDTLNIVDATLVGWSYGAMVCMDWVRKYGSHRAKNFIFTGSHGGLVPYTPEELENKKKINEQLRQQTPDFTRDLQGAKDFIGTMTHGSIPDPMREVLLLSRQMLPHYAQQAMGSRAFENSDLKDSLNRPLLFIQGEHDFANTPATIRTVASTVPQSQVEVISGAGHVPSMEAADQFNTLVRTFAEEKRKGGLTMKFVKIVTGSDGESHFVDQPLLDPEAKPSSMLTIKTGSEWDLSQSLPGHTSDYHTTRAPRLLIVLQGALEIGVRPGNTHRFHAGDMIHACDTTGKGHTSAIVGDEVCRVLSAVWDPSEK